MDQNVVTLAVAAGSFVAGAVAWHYCHAKVASEAAVAKAKLDWLENAVTGTAAHAIANAKNAAIVVASIPAQIEKSVAGAVANAVAPIHEAVQKVAASVGSAAVTVKTDAGAIGAAAVAAAVAPKPAAPAPVVTPAGKGV